MAKLKMRCQLCDSLEEAFENTAHRIPFRSTIHTEKFRKSEFRAKHFEQLGDGLTWSPNMHTVSL